MNGLGDLANLQLGLLHLGLHLGPGERRQEQRGQNGDDADDDEQFDQGERRGVRSAESGCGSARARCQYGFS